MIDRLDKNHAHVAYASTVESGVPVSDVNRSRGLSAALS